MISIIARVILYVAIKEFGIPTTLTRLTRIIITNVLGQSSRITVRILHPQKRHKIKRRLSCIIFNLALEKVIRGADINATRAIFIHPTTRLGEIPQDV